MTNEERDLLLDRLLQNQANFTEQHNNLILEIDKRLLHLEELQVQNQVAISRLNNQIANYTEQHHTTLLSFAEQHHNAIVEIDNRLIRLEALVEAFIRGSRHNGGSQES